MKKVVTAFKNFRNLLFLSIKNYVGKNLFFLDP